MSDSNTYPKRVSLPIGVAARMLGVSVSTLRNWDRENKIQSFRTPGGQRRFDLAVIEGLIRARSDAA